MQKNISIIIDYREKISGIPDLLIQNGTPIEFCQLKIADYVINNELAIERKSAEDFIQSLISGRLFNQCARLAKTAFKPFMLLEGNPFQTHHQIDKQAIKGALLSVIASWHIPVIYSKNQEDSANQLLLLAKQATQQSHWVKLHGNKPKKLRNSRLRFLQGLPDIGPVMASRLLEHFGSIEAAIKANEKKLQKVEGIGKKTAGKIRNFLARN